MINYPEIMKKLDDYPSLRAVGFDISKNGFILKGSKITPNEVIITSSDNTQGVIEETELKTKQKQQIDILSERIKEPIKEAFKINNLLLGASIFMILNGILVKVPLIIIPFGYTGALAIKDSSKLIRLKKQVNNDKWFSDNEDEVNKGLTDKRKLYKKLSEQSKEILIRDGKITLNNIDEFPKNDLRLVRRNISRELKRDNKAKVKILSR